MSGMQAFSLVISLTMMVHEHSYKSCMKYCL